MSEKSLSEIADAYRDALPAGDNMEFEITSLDRLGIPVYSTAHWPADGGPFCNGVGYGSTVEEARTSAYGECVESAFALRAMRSTSPARASYTDLVGTYGTGSVMDPVTGCLPAGSPYTPDTELDWVETRKYPDGETVMVPVEFVATRGADLAGLDRELLFTPVTNGLGAGLSVERALQHAVLELLQRDGNGVSFRALDRGTVIDLDDVEDEEMRDLLSRLESQGVRVTAKLAATDFGLSNVYVVGHDLDPSGDALPLISSACGEAVHPDREYALRKATLEFCASRVRKLFSHGPLEPVREISPTGYMERFLENPLGSEEERSLAATLDWLTLSQDEMVGLLSDTNFLERERVPLSTLPDNHQATRGERGVFGFVVDRLRNEGFEVLYTDLSRDPSSDVRAVKALSPGLEVETMSYGRIGARNLSRLLDRDTGLVGIGDPPSERPEARRILLTGKQEARFGGPAWFDYAAAERVVGRLYPMYREPGRHVAALAAGERGIYS